MTLKETILSILKTEGPHTLAECAEKCVERGLTPSGPDMRAMLNEMHDLQQVAQYKSTMDGAVVWRLADE